MSDNESQNGVKKSCQKGKQGGVAPLIFDLVPYFKTLWPNISLCSCLEFIKKIVKAFLKPLS